MRILVVLRGHHQLALLLAPEYDQVEIDCRFQRVNLPVAVHYLEVLTEGIQNLIVLLDEVDGLMIYGTVHD